MSLSSSRAGVDAGRGSNHTWQVVSAPVRSWSTRPVSWNRSSARTTPGSVTSPPARPLDLARPHHYAQLYLARPLAADIRLPWQRPCPPGRLTPARVRRGFRNIRQMLPCPASAPKPGKPGPGRPPGSKNRRPATRHDVGKTVKRGETIKKTRRQAG